MRTLKIVSWNVNGLRSVHTKGFIPWLRAEDPDIVCLQETRASEEDLPEELLAPPGYHAFFNAADKKGYSGVAIYTKVEPLEVSYTLGHSEFDSEGRMIELSFPSFTLMNLYMPNGGRTQERMAYKLEVYDKLLSYAKTKRPEPMILAGDMNIAPQEIDLARPKENKKNTMFTPEERAAFAAFLTGGYSDIFRELHPEEPGCYTWWPYFAHARERNLGWRIDHFLISEHAKRSVTEASILSTVQGSDHCPVRIVYQTSPPGPQEAEAHHEQNIPQSAFAEAV